MKHKPVKDHAERKRISALIERCEKEQTMSDRLLKESDVLRIAFQLPLAVNSAFADAVKAIPSADRPQGEWIEVDDVSISCRCSVCGWESHLYEDDVYGMPYCPNCGARMKGASNGENIQSADE